MRTSSTLGVFFFTRKKRSNPKKLDIYVRITVDKRHADISIKRDILICEWDVLRIRAKETHQNLILLNSYLDDVRAEILNAHKQLHSERKLITAKAIKLRYLGEDEQRMSLMGLIKYHNTNMVQSLKPGTMKNYYSTEKYLAFFVFDHFKTDDIFLMQLNYRFIVDFERYIRNYKPKKKRKTCSNNGAMKHLERLMKMVTLAVKMEWLDKDPFKNFKLKFDKTERDYLTERELDLIEETIFTQTGHERVKDVFLFSCYTGISYVDLRELRADQLALGIDGNYWIHTKRAKTNEPIKIPLLPKALEIIEKYNDELGKGSKLKLLPVYSNQKTNKYLKLIASDCGIHKTITFHVARHTFATTVTLSHGVPIETVSKLLGHTQLRTTQIYARVLQKKVAEDMGHLMKYYRSKDKRDGESNKSKLSNN